MSIAAENIGNIKQDETVAKPKKTRKEKIYTLREYLEKEERSAHKHEFHHGKIKRMPGGKAKHSEISANIVVAIKQAVKQLATTFRVYNSDLKIYIKSADKAVYPDALVICENPEYWEDREDLIVNPLVIVEVASKSTRDYDRGAKFLLYETLPSFKEYVLVEQDTPSVEIWFRESENLWRKSTENDLEKTIKLNALGVSIALADIYDNIEFAK